MTLKEFKQKLVDYSRTLIPPEYEKVIRVPGTASSQDFILRSTKEKPVRDFCQRVFGTETKSFKISRKENLFGEEVLESFAANLTRENDQIDALFTHISEGGLLELEKKRIAHNLKLAFSHPKSEVFNFLNKAFEAKLIQKPMDSNKQKTWDEFLSSWPVERVRNMTLEEYNNSDRDDSFCYWMEKKIENLGSIWGGSSYKFGIYKRLNTTKVDERTGYTTDGEYSWVSKYGNDRETAFNNVKNQIISVVDAAVNNNLNQVNDVKLGEGYKWKIAAMYHRRIPLIYRPDALNYLIKYFNKSATSSSEKYRSLAEEKKEDEDIFSFSDRLWNLYQKETKDGSEEIKVQKIRKPVNQILYGPPGTGKTYRAIDKCVELIDPESFDPNDHNQNKARFDELVDQGRIVFTTFHQSLGYEDFIEGIKPEPAKTSGQVIFKVVDGIFKKICLEAEKYAHDLNKKESAKTLDHVLVIDEINRGNVSQIFGELITLIEEDKRAGQDEAIRVTLPYSKKEFSVPSNLYIIGTMNTADRSVEALDVALRRRFTFEYMPPNYSLGQLQRELEGIKLSTLLQVINHRIILLKDEDHQIGHSYLLKVKNTTDLKLAFSRNIIPLLKEYFYNDYSKIRLVLGNEFVEPIQVPKFATNDIDIIEDERYTLKIIDEQFDIIKALKATLGNI